MTSEFDRLIGEWHGEGLYPDPELPIVVDQTIRRMGEFIILSSVAGSEGAPDSLSVIGGAPAGEPQPMRYFDERGVQRLFLTTIERSTWRIWLAPGQDWNGPNGPGFNQRFIGEVTADGNAIDGRWERGMGEAGDVWELDFPLRYERRG